MVVVVVVVVCVVRGWVVGGRQPSHFLYYSHRPSTRGGGGGRVMCRVAGRGNTWVVSTLALQSKSRSTADYLWPIDIVSSHRALIYRQYTLQAMRQCRGFFCYKYDVLYIYIAFYIIP